jgi:transcriptional regulator with XRE-family HTH domain
MTPRERAKAHALALRANGLSVRQVAERVGVPRGTVADWLRGRGEWYEIRECALCGDRFIATSGRQRFCTPQHRAKHRRVFGPPSALDAYRERARALEGELARLYRERARALEAELARLRARLEGRDA